MKNLLILILFGIIMFNGKATILVSANRVQASVQSREEIEREINRVFGQDSFMAKKIVWCESSFRPQVIHKNRNGSVDVGLFQVNSVHRQSTTDMQDPVKNIAFAKKLFDKQGWKPWVCRRII